MCLLVFVDSNTTVYVRRSVIFSVGMLNIFVPFGRQVFLLVSLKSTMFTTWSLVRFWDLCWKVYTMLYVFKWVIPALSSLSRVWNCSPSRGCSSSCWSLKWTIRFTTIYILRAISSRWKALVNTTGRGPAGTLSPVTRLMFLKEYSVCFNESVMSSADSPYRLVW